MKTYKALVLIVLAVASGVALSGNAAPSQEDPKTVSSHDLAGMPIMHETQIFSDRNSTVGTTVARAILGNRIYIAWISDRNSGGPNNLHIEYSEDGGKTFGHPYTNVWAGVGPSMCAFEGQLYVAWVDVHGANSPVYLSRVVMDGGSIKGMTAPWNVGNNQPGQLGESGAWPPTLTCDDRGVWMAWGDGNLNLRVARVVEPAKK